MRHYNFKYDITFRYLQCRRYMSNRCRSNESVRGDLYIYNDEKQQPRDFDGVGRWYVSL